MLKFNRGHFSVVEDFGPGLSGMFEKQVVALGSDNVPRMPPRSASSDEVGVLVES
jgi:hypothetical protein